VPKDRTPAKKKTDTKPSQTSEEPVTLEDDNEPAPASPTVTPKKRPHNADLSLDEEEAANKVIKEEAASKVIKEEIEEKI
jgi:hypothetical protein